MNRSYFITGTDTNVGKTLASCALLHALAATNRRVVGMKPVVTGQVGGKWQDVELLIAASNIIAPRDQISPYALALPLAPNIAASLANIEIEMGVIRQAYVTLQRISDSVIVEGVGGFRVPLGKHKDTANLAKILALPVILVVGLRLGCLNHALLTVESIQATGLVMAGWIANCIDPHMRVLQENICALKQRLGCPLIGILPYMAKVNAKQCAKLLNLADLEYASCR